MKPQVIATGISSLDEARYFSAMGVDWIGFNLDQISADAVNAITDWIVGPKFFAEWPSAETDAIFEITQKTAVQGICLPQSEEVPAWYDGSVIIRLSAGEPEITSPYTGILLLTSGDEMHQRALDEMIAHNTCWLEIDPGQLTPDRLRDITAHGIVIRSEESPADGYARYDRFFELIEQLGDGA